MKKLFPILLFFACLTSNAFAAEVDYSKFGSPAEAFDEGYRSHIRDMYDRYSPEMSDDEKNTHNNLYDSLMENISGGGWPRDEEEYDLETLQFAYEDGESYAVHDFYVISATFSQCSELIEEAYDEGIYEATYGEEGSEQQYNKGYEEGYDAGCNETANEYEYSASYKLGSGIVSILAFGGGLLLIYLIGKALLHIGEAIISKIKH